MNDCVDEVWVYTSYLKMCYVRSGIHADKIQVIPCGVDPQLFNPQKPPLEPVKKAVNGRFCFLFNGGTTLRKGVDVLVNAYLSEFKADEPVCLVIKDSQMYGKGLAGKIIELCKRKDIAPMIYIADNLPYDDIPALYNACDCYVHPYRAEGYGLPIAEALACAKPVIVTGGGACLDFVEPDQAFFIKCTFEQMKEKNVSGMETVDYPFWLVPDMGHLQNLMRYVFNNRALAAEKGRAAGKNIRTYHTWKTAASRAAERIVALLKTTECISRDQLILSAEVYMENGDYTHAKEYFEQVLHLYGEDSAAYQGMGLVATQTEQFEDACEYFRRADLIRPASPEILFCWYNAALKAGKTEDLRLPLARACEVHTDNKELIILKETLLETL